jgi:hypothetical protein
MDKFKKKIIGSEDVIPSKFTVSKKDIVKKEHSELRVKTLKSILATVISTSAVYLIAGVGTKLNISYETLSLVGRPAAMFASVIGTKCLYDIVYYVRDTFNYHMNEQNKQKNNGKSRGI